MTEQQKISRKEQILQCLASMLENPKAERITTASLAKSVGVSEAALYRHFPSKARMFEGLIEFIEDTIFTRVSMIVRESEDTGIVQCQKILGLLLFFSEKNPGISRILTGSALTGEHERLGERVGQLFNRLDTQIRQILRESEVKDGLRLNLHNPASANLILAFAEGRIQQYVRSNFEVLPTEHWENQWQVLINGLVKTD
jgi:TetR/AcrR family transcriptional regulator